MAGVLRTTLAAVVATLLMLVLQTPWMALGCYLIFLISYETPYLCFKTAALSVSSVIVGVALTLSLVIITGNNPTARVLGVAVFTFGAAFFSRNFVLPVLPQNVGIVSVMMLSLWEFHYPPEVTLHRCLWPIATISLCVSCKIAIEYLFTRRDPVAALDKEIRFRFEAMEQMFLCYCDPGHGDLGNHIRKVRQYAFIGQGKMPALLQETNLRRKNRTALYDDLPELISNLARLLELAAAFALHHSSVENEFDRARLNRIAKALAEARRGHIDEIENIVSSVPPSATDELAHMEQILLNMAATSQADQVISTEISSGETTHKSGTQWLASDAFRNPNYLFYTLKLSLCATFCYVVYNALDWPGISTAVLTVLITGLSTTGASNQKILFRIIGSTIGGVVFGLGCVVFVFPHFETVTPFLIVVGIVSFIAAWVARGPHISYAGMQIAFSFYLVAFEGFSAPVKLEPARDRCVGILLAFIVMGFIFHQLHPERTVGEMRRLLVHIIYVQVDLLQAMSIDAPSGERSARISELRTRIREASARIGSLADAVPFEFGRYREGDLIRRDYLLNALSSAGNLVLSIVTLPHESADTPDEIREFREALGHDLRLLANQLDQNPRLAHSSSAPPLTTLDAFRTSSTSRIHKTLGVFDGLVAECQHSFAS